MKHSLLPLLGFAGFSGVGKTTLLAEVLPLLTAQGIRIGMIKHAHHNFDIDQPGKDSYVLRKAGARQMLIASSQRWALMTDLEQEQEPCLSELVARLDHSPLDLILVEGFKHESFPKIEVYRESLGHQLLCAQDASIIALACDAAPRAPLNIPHLDLNQPEQIARFIEQSVLQRKI